MNDVKVVLLDMPEECKGQVRITPDSDYYVILNARYNAEQLRETYNHEIRHILKKHHSIVGSCIQEIELEANDTELLLDEIKRVEECGLPLELAFVKQQAAEVGEAAAAIAPEIVAMDNIAYELPKGMTKDDVLRGFDAWAEQDMDDNFRRRELTDEGSFVGTITPPSAKLAQSPTIAPAKQPEGKVSAQGATVSNKNTRYAGYTGFHYQPKKEKTDMQELVDRAIAKNIEKAKQKRDDQPKATAQDESKPIEQWCTYKNYKSKSLLDIV